MLAQSGSERNASHHLVFILKKQYQNHFIFFCTIGELRLKKLQPSLTQAGLVVCILILIIKYFIKSNCGSAKFALW